MLLHDHRLVLFSLVSTKPGTVITDLAISSIHQTADRPRPTNYSMQTPKVWFSFYASVEYAEWLWPKAFCRRQGDERYSLKVLPLLLNGPLHLRLREQCLWTHRPPEVMVLKMDNQELVHPLVPVRNLPEADRCF